MADDPYAAIAKKPTGNTQPNADDPYAAMATPSAPSTDSGPKPQWLTSPDLTSVSYHQIPHSLSDLGREGMRALSNIGATGLGLYHQAATDPWSIPEGIFRMSAPGMALEAALRHGATVYYDPKTGQGVTPEAIHHPLETAEGLIGQAGAAPIGEKVLEKSVVKPIAAIPKVLKAGGRILADTTPTTTADLATETARENAVNQKAAELENQRATQRHLEETQSAIEEQKGKELLHQHELKQKTQELEAQRAEAARKAAQAQTDAARKTAEKNAQIQAKHAEAAQRAQEHNVASEQVSGLRDQTAQELDKETQDYYAQEDAAKAKTKEEENAAWEPWREAMKDETIDGEDLKGRLKKAGVVGPEVERTLRQLEPDPEDAPAESEYSQARAQIMKAQGEKGDYASLSPARRSMYDQLTTSAGYSPDPIELDLDSKTGIPVEQVHRANSILQRMIRSGRFEGPVLGEMKQAAKVLRSAINRATSEAGAMDELDTAREATTKYQQAFGRERNTPITQDEIRRQQANPEAFKEEDEQRRLAAAAKVDPSIVDSYNRVKALREKLKSFPSEDVLRKGQKQAPRPPSVGDTRPGYRLQPQPTPKPAAAPTTTAAEEAFQTTPQPTRPTYPNRPQPSVADVKKIGLSDIQEANEAALEKRRNFIKTKGAAIASVYGAGRLLHSLVRFDPKGVFAGAGDIMAGLGPTQALAAAMDIPKVRDFLTRPTPAQIASIPPELRGDLPVILEAAKRAGLRIHPSFYGLVPHAATQH